MANSEITLSRVFAFEGKEVAQRKTGALEALSTVAALKEKIGKEAKEIKWPVALGEVVDKIDDLLRIPIGGVISSAWNKYRVLAKYLDRDKYSPSESFLVPLAEHTIKSKHRPHIEVFLDDKKIGSIDFEVDLSLTLKGFIAKIQDGRIREIKTGTCKAKGTIRCEDLLLFEKEGASLDLPGSIGLGEGVPISPLEAS